jgi:amino acid transporter
MGPVGKIRTPIVVFLLSLITLGIYQLYWTYQVFRELKEHTGQGVGPVVGLVIGLLISVVNLFLLPSEIGNMFAAEGQPKPVKGTTGFWNLIPLIGTIIWYLKVQGALNTHWEAHGAVKA